MDQYDDVATALVSLTASGIPADIQELLVYGDPNRGVPAGALYRALVLVRAERDKRRALTVGQSPSK
jgi:hypothetical protein